jgi:hypothetical protein
MRMKKSAWDDVQIPALVAHFAHMLKAKDGFSALVRGMVVVDQGLDLLLDGYLTLPLKKVKAELPHLTLNGKACIARAVGAITVDEYAFLKRCNSLRNQVAHRLNVDVTEAEEQEIVESYNASMSGFGSELSGGEPFHYPQMLCIALILYSIRLWVRGHALRNRKIRDVRDTPADSVSALGLATALMRLARDGGELTDERIAQTVVAYVGTAAVGLRIIRKREQGASFEEAVAFVSQQQPRQKRRYRPKR